MKLKNGFVLREVAGQTVVLPAGGGLDLNMMISLNDTGKFLWKLLEEESELNDLVSALLKEYDVDEKTAEDAVEKFITTLNKYEFLEC